ncbi:urease accessory protein UreF [Kineococcus sp. SYSU DK006]|uniref:urease accessory protein UreF n=1 Tax=Kineococcus sp. SYSU DK006 TaxID=3383127 RepID=UPI003D7C6D8B
MDPAALLRVLALGDSAFPSGGLAFSGGLEAAVHAGHVLDEDGLRTFVVAVLRGRWALTERVFLARCARAPGLAGALAVDHDVETSATVEELRRASRRAGRAALGTHVALGVPEAVEFAALVDAGRSPGHLVTVQAVCLRAGGLDPDEVEAVSAWNLVSQLAAAGLRLGLCGHLGAQRVIATGNAVAAEVLRGPSPPEPSTSTPLLDVLAARTVGDGRMFAG